MILWWLLFSAGRQGRNHDGELLEHLRPAELGAFEPLLAEGLGNVEARVFEENARAVAIWFEQKAHPGILDGSAGGPGEGETTGRIALQHFAAHRQSIEINFGVPRHTKREAMSD